MTEALRLIVSSKANEAEIIVASGIAIEICAGAKFIIETHRVGVVAEPVVGPRGEHVRIVLQILNLDANPDRKSGVSGKSVSVSVDHGGRRCLNQKKSKQKNKYTLLQ